MSVVIKKIGKKRYAYIAKRQGDKVLQEYLGSLSDPAVRNKINMLKAEKKVPVRFYTLFWDTNPLKVELNKNSRYIIERVLEFGDLEALLWIQNIYPTRLIIETCEISRKISQRSKRLWRIWFKINNES